MDKEWFAIRMRTSEKISSVFHGASSIIVSYHSLGALACAVYPDGVTEYMQVEYSEVENDSHLGSAGRSDKSLYVHPNYNKM